MPCHIHCGMIAPINGTLFLHGGRGNAGHDVDAEFQSETVDEIRKRFEPLSIRGGGEAVRSGEKSAIGVDLAGIACPRDALCVEACDVRTGLIWYQGNYVLGVPSWMTSTGARPGFFHDYAENRNLCKATSDTSLGSQIDYRPIRSFSEPASRKVFFAENSTWVSVYTGTGWWAGARQDYAYSRYFRFPHGDVANCLAYDGHVGPMFRAPFLKNYSLQVSDLPFTF